MPDITSRYYPTLATIVDTDEIPDVLGFVKEGVISVLGKIHYKDLQYSKSVKGDAAFYSLSIITKKRLDFEIPETGIFFVLNPDLGTGPDFNVSVFPLTFSYEWKVLAYLRGFDLTDFSFTPKEIYEVALKVLNISEEQVMAQFLNIFAEPIGEDTTVIEQYVADVNSTMDTSLVAGEDTTLRGLSEDIFSETDDFGSSAGFTTYINVDGDLDETKTRLKQFFRSLLPNDIEAYIKDLLIPKIRTTLALNAGLEFPRNLLKPVDLGNVNPSTTDMAKITFAEFGLVYSNDWMIFPYTVSAGSICELKEIEVTDCFGNRTKVEEANTGDPADWERWSFFALTTTGNPSSGDPKLFIPPVAQKVMQSDPIEEVQFIRDEMANMVWGIEKVIPDGFSAGRDGYESALKYVNYLKSKADPESEAELITNEATVQYRLANSVPENWIPFTPIQTSALSRQIQLQRAAMPRFIDGVGIDRVRPRTILLKENMDEVETAYYIHEDEIPRAGAIVKRTWQRTRTENGKVVTWTGRRKTTGRGEGSSNLSFDNIVDK